MAGNSSFAESSFDQEGRFDYYDNSEMYENPLYRALGAAEEYAQVLSGGRAPAYDASEVTSTATGQSSFASDVSADESSVGGYDSGAEQSTSFW